ncbi:hypothetical protein BRD12_01275 [Halobacteriales archaeon SW_12_67_38]|nr:MAG: hypothetical protein BRD12_01275 [Halobacteriales archaeon SW_12_67_38]
MGIGVVDTTVCRFGGTYPVRASIRVMTEFEDVTDRVALVTGRDPEKGGFSRMVRPFSVRWRAGARRRRATRARDD